jgi:hypothetical protein
MLKDHTRLKIIILKEKKVKKENGQNALSLEYMMGMVDHRALNFSETTFISW